MFLQVMLMILVYQMVKHILHMSVIKKATIHAINNKKDVRNKSYVFFYSSIMIGIKSVIMEKSITSVSKSANLILVISALFSISPN